MNNPQNPAIHPEIGPRSVRTPMEGSKTVTSGAIIFNQAPLPSNDPNDPRRIIEEAITGGDLVERRVEQLSNAITPLTEQE